MLILHASEARLLFRAGKGRDGYVDGEVMLREATQAIDIFEARHPGCQMLGMFDNATIHQKRPADGLSARRMTLKPKAEWFPVLDGVRMRDAQLPNGQSQLLYFPPDDPKISLRGHFKGTRQILSERGKWFPMDADAARDILFNEPDFVNQKSALEELFISRGHICDFYPKFHCELNFIEQYWGASKRRYRVTAATQGTAEMQTNVIAALNAVTPLEILR